MAKDTDKRRRISRREVLAGGLAIGAAIVGGVGATRVMDGEVIPTTTPDHIADRIYTGSSAISLDLPDGIGLDFFSRARRADRDDIQLLVSAYEYPTGSLVKRSAMNLDIYIGDTIANLDDDGEESVFVTASPDDGDLIDHAEADATVKRTSRDGLHELDDGGRLYNLVEGANGDPVAQLQTRVSPRTDGLADTDTPVVFAFQLAGNDGVEMLRQTPPVDMTAGNHDDGVTVPTRGRRYLPGSPDTAKFRRVTREGRHLMWYNWMADGRKHGLVYPVHKLSYAAARNRDARYTTETYRDALTNPYGREIGRAIYQMAASKEGSKSTEARAFTLARRFGQSWPYVKDTKTHDELHYSNYVEETLVEGAGDCEDMAVLMASIFAQPPFDYDVNLLYPPKHVAIGIAADDLPPGVVPAHQRTKGVTVDGTKYVYVESTALKKPGEADRDLSKVRATYDGEWGRFNTRSLTGGAIRYLRTLVG